MKLRDLPLWRLLVALDDAERVAGPESPTARVLAREIQRRLKAIPPHVQEQNNGGPNDA